MSLKGCGYHHGDTENSLKSCRQNVAAFNLGANMFPAFVRACIFYGIRLRREFRIFDDVAEPLRNISVSQVEQPCLVIDAVGDLHEDRQVLSSKVEGSFRTAEIEGPLGRKIAFRVFTSVTQEFRRALRVRKRTPALRNSLTISGHC